MTDPVVAALDGPAGSGKSSVSREAARRLGWGFLDTGAAYRALAWHVLERGGDTADETVVLSALDDFDYTISLDTAERWVRVGDADVTTDIRDPRVTAAVSGVARVAFVRTAVNALFRRLIADSGLAGIVVEGRDITTVVVPDAPVRILLTADPAERAARRGVELGAETATVAAAMARRDAADSTVPDFLTAAPGVTVVDSTELDFDQTVAAVLAVIHDRTGQSHDR